MAKKMLIDATHAEETRVVVVDGNKVEEFDFESENKRQLAGNIYLAKVTRVEPSLQAAFIDYGGNRHGFLAFSEIHPDYYQIPVADREALMEEERAYAEAQRAKDEEDEKKPKRRGRGRGRSKAAATKTDDAVATKEVEEDAINGMETIDLDDAAVSEDEAQSPMERVSETPVEEPSDTDQPVADAQPETPADAGESDDASEDDTDGDKDDSASASEKDESIESVADEDDSDDIRPARKPRPRRYKIQEVIKVRQILLVQVVKEERGNKGAALTTYLSLAGRYCVLMPNTARGGGISRKITNAVDRKKLKEIANEIEVPQGAGLIVRTAGAKRTKAEIKRDYEYLQRLWELIRDQTLKSIAPAKIHEEGDLIKRSIRDLYNRDIDEVFVEGERGYRNAKDFMKMIMPSHAKNVKRYEDTLPLFARYQVESYLAGMFNPTVQLKSGGYIVIGITEALVAIDVNSGRSTKEGSIEDTALKTNLEAAEEVARQLRLRDLAGLIVIDFIDMDERRNNTAVEKRIKDKLKTDRARIQIGRISGFGLMEMSRQRLRPGMIEATTQPCAACHGTGLIRSDDNLALSILRQIEEEGVRARSKEVLIKAPIGIANYLMNQKRDHVAQIEARYGLSVRIEGDPHLVSPDFAMEKFKTASRAIASTSVLPTLDTSIMDKLDAEDAAAAEAEEAAMLAKDAAERSNRPEGGGDGEDGEGRPKRRRRRRRRRKSGGGEQQADAENADTSSDETADAAAPEQSDAPADDEKPKKRTRSRGGRSKTAAAKAEDGDAVTEADASAEPEAAEPAAEEKPKPKRRSRAKPKPEPVEGEAEATESTEAPEEAPKPKRTRAPRKKKEPVATEAAAPEPVAEAAPEPTPEPVVVAEAVAEPEAEAPKKKTRRKGWWSLGK
jgi:ribonuclease E